MAAGGVVEYLRPVHESMTFSAQMKDGFLSGENQTRVDGKDEVVVVKKKRKKRTVSIMQGANGSKPRMSALLP